ncbi:MAG: hypothetical protein HC849_03740 [Oscillatoriales cyanobacterium RU_3_3]|nr:hypothetical protein [Oscillatoriales cyanobacterium RU_3_3]
MSEGIRSNPGDRIHINNRCKDYGLVKFWWKKGKQSQGFGKSQERKSRKPRRTFVLEKL